MAEEEIKQAEDAVDIEAIMNEIRKQIRDKRHDANAEVSPVFEGSLPVGFYDALGKAEQANSRLQPKMMITESSLPIVGPLIQRFRFNFHQLVLFYVNQLASNQIQFNTQIIKALTLISQDLAEPVEND